MNWIKVEERLPNIDHIVLWLYESGGIIQDALDKDCPVEFFLRGCDRTGRITHWMEIEYPVEEVQKNAII